MFTDKDAWPIDRTHDNHLRLQNQRNGHLGCIRKPLLALNSDCCPPDMLHLKKGIISKLINQLVDWVIIKKKEELLISEMQKNKIPFV